MLSLNFLLRIVNFPFSWAQNFTKSMSLTLVSPCPPCTVFIIIFLQLVLTTPFLYISSSLLCCCVTISYGNGFIQGRTGQPSYPMGTSFSMVSKVTCHTNIVRLTEMIDSVTGAPYLYLYQPEILLQIKIVPYKLYFF